MIISGHSAVLDVSRLLSAFLVYFLYYYYILSPVIMSSNLAAISVMAQDPGCLISHLQLKKKSNSVAYPHCREESTLDEWRIMYIKNTHNNLSDLLTKHLYTGEKRSKLCKH